jgi:hypothetical protein
MVIGVWVLTTLIVGIPIAVHGKRHYYGASGYCKSTSSLLKNRWNRNYLLTGCWITEAFQAEKIVTEYLWVWVAGVVMTILYTIMFAVMRGWFIIDNGIHWYKNYNPSHTGQEEIETEEEKEMKAIANLLLL